MTRTSRVALRGVLSLGTVLAFAVLTALPAMAVEPVATSANWEQAPSGGNGYVTYSANSEAHPRHFNTWLVPDGGEPIRVNEEGTRGGTAGIDGGMLVYEQDGDLKLYDIATGTRSDPPAGVNTEFLEVDPSMSGEWLLFSRVDWAPEADPPHTWIVLRNLVTDEERILLESDSFAFSEQVNGNWVVYTDLTHEFRYDIQLEETIRIPGPGRRYVYGAGSVAEDGTVFVARQVLGPCGQEASIRRLDPDGTLTTTYVFGKNRQIAWKTFAVDQDGGGIDLLFDRFNCRKGNANVYRFPDADSAPPLVG
jgi:hypothetical protein